MITRKRYFMRARDFNCKGRLLICRKEHNQGVMVLGVEQKCRPFLAYQPLQNHEQLYAFWLRGDQSVNENQHQHGNIPYGKRQCIHPVRLKVSKICKSHTFLIDVKTG